MPKVKSSRVETVEEFLARGGTIERVPEAPREPQTDVVRKTQSGPVVFMTLDEAEFLYGEPSKAKPKKVKSTPKINLDVLPLELQAKWIKKLKEKVDVEGCEEEVEELKIGLSDRDDG